MLTKHFDLAPLLLLHILCY